MEIRLFYWPAASPNFPGLVYDLPARSNCTLDVLKTVIRPNGRPKVMAEASLKTHGRATGMPVAVTVENPALIYYPSFETPREFSPPSQQSPSTNARCDPTSLCLSGPSPVSFVVDKTSRLVFTPAGVFPVGFRIARTRRKTLLTTVSRTASPGLHGPRGGLGPHRWPSGVLDALSPDNGRESAKVATENRTTGPDAADDKRGWVRLPVRIPVVVRP